MSLFTKSALSGPPFSPIALALVLIALLLIVKLAKVGSRPPGLPPGPPTVPLLGNLHLVGSVHQRSHFQ